MKKAYNVYSIFEKTVLKAAMLTSVFAVCFLFSSQVWGQTNATPHKNNVNQPDFAVHAGATIPFTALSDNIQQLNPDLIKVENAKDIAKDLFDGHMSTSGLFTDPTATQEIEFELRRVFLLTLASELKNENDFSSSFSSASTQMVLQLAKYDQSLYTVPTPNAIAEGYIANFK